MSEDRHSIENLPASLDIAVFERFGTSRFVPVGDLPLWWHRLTSSTSSRTEPDLVEQFPLLELFLPEAEAFWARAAVGHLRSDIWTEDDPRVGQLYLRATALCVGERSFLAIGTEPQELFQYQQQAHEIELQKDTIERISRELDMKRLEAERATRAKSDFLAMMSHEIRTPLNAIIGMADLLSATSLTTEQQRYVQIFLRSGVSLLSLINDILDLSKAEAGKIDLEAVEMSLPDVVSRAVEVMEGRAREKGLVLSSDIDPTVPVHLVGDPNRLRQILINLLSNSLKFTDRGSLTVRVRREIDLELSVRLLFSVSDTGIGIPADKVSLIFDSFTQADTSTTRKYGGTGPGLTISKQLVELMGGRIWVESTVGVGSTFFFTAEFAFAKEGSATGTGSDAVEDARPAALTGVRILLADDSEDNRYLIVQYLKNSGSVIDTAENGQIASEMFRANRYDIVLMDLEMPVLDGYEAARRIRDHERSTGQLETPILALTAHASSDISRQTEAVGITAHLTKPIRKATLISAVVQYAAQRFQRDNLPSCTGNSGSSECESVVSSPPRIYIQVEESLRDVVPGYLARRRNEITTYREALESGDFESIRMLGHKMKGTGAGYGFEKLTALGATIEQAAKGQDATVVRAAVAELEKYLAQVELVRARG